MEIVGPKPLWLTDRKRTVIALRMVMTLALGAPEDSSLTANSARVIPSRSRKYRSRSETECNVGNWSIVNTRLTNCS